MFIAFDYLINFDYSSYLKKIKVIKNIKYILKLNYVINHIIFNFFIILYFLIRRMIKVG
jgi:hypothetical protein